MSESSWQDLEKIYIDSDSLNSPVAKRALSLFPSRKVQIVAVAPFSSAKGELSAKSFEQSKKELYITPFRGQFFKRCPGSRPGLTCCNYFVLNLGQQCNMNCSYCYLQSFLNSPVMQIYSNIDQALLELSELGKSMAQERIRIGTGEIIDSLSLDPLTLYSRDLIEFFKGYPKWTLEFKTKSSHVDQFLDVDHGGNVIVSFSVNPQLVIDQEEHGTADLAARLTAAKKARAKGFQIAFHIDPMIYHPDWRDSYFQLVDAIANLFAPEEITTMSIGGLRFQPEQRHLMRERFGMKSLVANAEVFVSADGKLRYQQSIRQQMFQYVKQEFKARGYAKIFLCMETPEVWLESTGGLPKKDKELNELFDHRVTRKVKAIGARPDLVNG